MDQKRGGGERGDVGTRKKWGKEEKRKRGGGGMSGGHGRLWLLLPFAGRKKQGRGRVHQGSLPEFPMSQRIGPCNTNNPDAPDTLEKSAATDDGIHPPKGPGTCIHRPGLLLPKGQSVNILPILPL